MRVEVRLNILNILSATSGSLALLVFLGSVWLVIRLQHQLKQLGRRLAVLREIQEAERTEAAQQATELLKTQERLTHAEAFNKSQEEQLEGHRRQQLESYRHLLGVYGELQAIKGREQQQVLWLDEAKAKLLELNRQHQELQDRYSRLLQDHAGLTSTFMQRQRSFEEQQGLLEANRRQLKAEFEDLAGRIFESRSRTFSLQNQQALDVLLRPFREQMDGFRKKLEDIHHKDVEQQESLAQQLVQLNLMTRKFSQEAQASAAEARS